MTQPKVLILRTAGTNCDAETETAFQLAGAETALVHIQHLISGKANLSDYHILAIPGGFSYGDDIAAGILLAIEMRHKLTNALNRFVADGKLMLGICNGFQVLVRTGLLPGSDTPEMTQRATLAMNTSAKFECRWVDLETQESPCVFTRNIKTHVYLPVAHAEGRFTASEDVLSEVEANNQVVFRYAESRYPNNPNGSDGNIAGICDATGRIFGLMPHPERFLTKWNHPRWTRLSETQDSVSEEGAGLVIFKNAVSYVKANL